jgi:hypothetical protein
MGPEKKNNHLYMRAPVNHAIMHEQQKGKIPSKSESLSL